MGDKKPKGKKSKQSAKKAAAQKGAAVAMGEAGSPMPVGKKSKGK